MNAKEARQATDQAWSVKVEDCKNFVKLEENLEPNNLQALKELTLSLALKEVERATKEPIYRAKFMHYLSNKTSKETGRDLIKYACEKLTSLGYKVAEESLVVGIGFKYIYIVFSWRD